MLFDPSLYFIADSSHLTGDPLNIISQAIRGGITMLQLREKTMSDQAWLNYAPSVIDLAHRNNVPVIINDRADLVTVLKADGVHLGQSDMPVTAARQLLGPNAIIGVSAHTEEEAVYAEKEGADYIGVGTAFPTTSKTDIKGLLGIDGLRNVRSAVLIPVVAIGGIDPENVESVMATGVQGVAVISAIGRSQDPERSTGQLIKLIKRQ